MIDFKHPDLENLRASIKLELTCDSPRLPYRRRCSAEKGGIVHWGQRKLLLSEILFLTRWGHLSNWVVYAGSAPGNHIPFLASLFPSHRFVLVDPGKFCIKPSSRIEIRNEYFTDEMAREFESQKVLFISDIRTADFRQMNESENEKVIQEDNEMQMKWVEIMKPVKSMLKFRCPYPDKGQPPDIKMYEGEVFFQLWPGATSTETRLVVSPDAKIVEYNCLKYEEQLFYHNTVTRMKEFRNPVIGEGGDKLSKKFDFSGEILILLEFLEKFPQFLLPCTSLLSNLSRMSRKISPSITSSGRTLATGHDSKRSNYQSFPLVDHKAHKKSYPEKSTRK